MKSDDLVLKNISADFFFSKNQDEKVNFEDQDLIELQPFGMSIDNDTTRPFLLLKDKTGHYTLPVGITQIEAGVALTQSASNSQGLISPHNFSEKLLNSLDIKIKKCLFVEINGHHQYVRLYMSGHPRYESLKIKAEDAMSLCLHLKIPFYASIDFIQRSKIMTTEISASVRNSLNHPDFTNIKKQLH